MGARILLLGLLVIGWLAIGCTKQISDRNLVLIDPSEATEIAEGRKRLFGLAGTASAVWVDPRSARAFRQGHIPGAISLPFQNLSTESDRLKGYDVLIVYGDDYDDELARGMSKRLMELGFKDVRTLRGGLKAWTRAGYELEEGG